MNLSKRIKMEKEFILCVDVTCNRKGCCERYNHFKKKCLPYFVGPMNKNSDGTCEYYIPKKNFYVSYESYGSQKK